MDGVEQDGRKLVSVPAASSPFAMRVKKKLFSFSTFLTSESWSVWNCRHYTMHPP